MNEHVEELKERKINFVIATVESGESKDEKRFNKILSEIETTQCNLKEISTEIDNIKAFLDVLKRNKESVRSETFFEIMFFSVVIDRTGKVRFEYSTSGRILKDTTG